MSAREKYTVDLSEGDMSSNGLALLAKLRRENPVCYIPSIQCWLVTRAADCEECQVNETLYKPYQPDWTVDPILGTYHIQSRFVDQDKWQRYRKGNDHVLGARPMATITEELIRPLVEQQIETLKGRREIDLLDDYFAPINVAVNKSVMGVPELSNETVLRWHAGIGDSFNNMGADPERIEQAKALRAEISAYFAPVIAVKHATPDDSWVSHMMQYAWGDTLAQKQEFIQGHITTMMFSGSKEGAEACVNTIIGLSSNPADFARFRSAPTEHAVAAGEEGLRWLPPTASQRRTNVDVELGGVSIPAGEDLVICLLSANHDEAKFGDDADIYKMDRFQKGEGKRLTHMTFGLLPRFCQGSTMVRALLKTALPRLFEAYPDIKFADDVVEKTSIGFVYNVNHLACTLG